MRPGRSATRSVLATGSTILATAGLLLVLLTGLALAQGVTGGCTATINTQDPATMTQDEPLVVGEGDIVSVRGIVPASAQGVPEDRVESSTIIRVSIVEGIAEVSSDTYTGRGYEWGGDVNVDDYLKWGTGLYLVEGDASGTPGWACVGSGYVQLDGNPLSKPVGQIAGGLSVLGAVGAVFAFRPKRKPGMLGSALPGGAAGGQTAGASAGAGMGTAPGGETLLDLGASVAWVALIALAVVGIPVLGLAAVAVAAPDRRREWAHGRPVLGFVSGLVLGVGISVLLQQYAYWPLTTLTAIVFPLFTATITGVRAWLGRPYQVEFRSRHDSA